MKGEEFFRGYVAAALWAETDDDGEFLSENYSVSDFSADAMNAMFRDCEDFVASHEKELSAFCDLTGRDMSCAGHDFWLTRNGHGAGFWDRGGGMAGNRLTEAARAFGPQEIYVGDDNRLYIFGREG